MKRITLTEYRTAQGVALSAEHVSALWAIASSILISPSSAGQGTYDLTAGSHVGLIRVGDIAVEIRPKIGVARLLFLISYAIDPWSWREQEVHFAPHESVVEAVLPGFLWQIERAFRQGVLQGYREVEEAATTVRGRIRFGDQLRRHHGRSFPVEVRYDDFTVDIELNRLIKAALFGVRRLPLRSASVLHRLRHAEALLGDVSLVSYDTANLPQVAFNRLNDRYRAAVELSKLLLRGISYDLGEGGVAAAAFLVDMNKVFEDFVVVALREALRLSPRVFPQGAAGHTLALDSAGRVRLEPDISWWDAGRCVFVGDVKYKRSSVMGGLHPDLYQVLAYAVGADLPEGVLIYAAGEADPVRHMVPHAAKMLEVMTLDLEASPDEVLSRVGGIAERVRSMQARAEGPISRVG